MRQPAANRWEPPPARGRALKRQPRSRMCFRRTVVVVQSALRQSRKKTFDLRGDLQLLTSRHYLPQASERHSFDLGSLGQLLKHYERQKEPFDPGFGQEADQSLIVLA